MQIDFFTEGEILENIDRIEKILSTGIFEPQNLTHPLCQSAFYETMIRLRDLVAKCKTLAQNPIAFSEDVTIVPGKVANVSDLIKSIRDCLCHITSAEQNVEPQGRSVFNVKQGAGTLGSFNGVVFASKYQDDVMFCYGLHSIYLKRHIIRAFEEAKATLLPLCRRKP